MIVKFSKVNNCKNFVIFSCRNSSIFSHKKWMNVEHRVNLNRDGNNFGTLLRKRTPVNGSWPWVTLADLELIANWLFMPKLALVGIMKNNEILNQVFRKSNFLLRAKSAVTLIFLGWSITLVGKSIRGFGSKLDGHYLRSQMFSIKQDRPLSY